MTYNINPVLRNRPQWIAGRNAGTAAPALRRRTQWVAGRCSPENIIVKGDERHKIRYHNGDTGDIIETIMAMDADAHTWIDSRAVECLRGDTVRDTLRNVWAFVKNHNRYQPDRPGHERVKSPRALFDHGMGDCKSFSIAEGALLRALGIRYKYRFAAYEKGDYTHVYIIAETPDGWVPIDAVLEYPLKEARYQKKKDIAPGAISGIGKAPESNTGKSWAEYVIIGLFIYLIAK